MSRQRRKEELIPLSKEQKENARAKIKEYMKLNFGEEPGNIQADMFLDYITEHIGAYYYNKALADSMAFMTEKAEDMYMLMKDED